MGFPPPGGQCGQAAQTTEIQGEKRWGFRRGAVPLPLSSGDSRVLTTVIGVWSLKTQTESGLQVPMSGMQERQVLRKTELNGQKKTYGNKSKDTGGCLCFLMIKS